MNKKEKFCITTYYDDRFKAVGDLSLLTLRAYAERHNGDVFIGNRLKIERPIPWIKIKIIQELFRMGYKKVMWVDADAIIVRDDESILNECEDGKDLYLVEHWDGRRSIPNSGVMLLQKTRFTKRLLEKVWRMDQYTDHVWWENAAIIHLLSEDDFEEEGIRREAKGLKRKEMERIKFIDVKWNSIPEVYNGQASSCKPIIKHYAGFQYERRVELMEKDMAEIIKTMGDKGD